MLEKTIEQEIIKFYIREDPYGFLSNFCRALQTNYSEEEYFYKTNEHWYQSHKAKELKMKNWIQKAPTAYAAMMAGRNLKPEEIIDDWNNKKIEVMKEGLFLKFKQNNELKSALLKTGYALLIEDSPTDMFWGGKLKGSKNMLGKLLMEVREELRKNLEEEIKKAITFTN